MKKFLLPLLLISLNVSALVPISDEELREIQITNELSSGLFLCSDLDLFRELDQFVDETRDWRCQKLLIRSMLYLTQEEIEMMIRNHLRINGQH